MERKVDKLQDEVERLAHPTGGRKVELHAWLMSQFSQLSHEELEELEQRTRAVRDDRESREKEEALQRTLHRLFGPDWRSLLRLE